MDVNALQERVSETVASYVDGTSREHGLAFLLEQSGQLAQAILHANCGNVDKELAQINR